MPAVTLERGISIGKQPYSNALFAAPGAPACAQPYRPRAESAKKCLVARL